MIRKILLLLCVCLVGSIVEIAEGSDKPDREKNSDRRTIELFKKLMIGSAHHTQHFKSAETALLERVEIQMWDDPVFIPYFRYDYDYQNGNRIETTTSYSSMQEDPEWELDERHLYSYENSLLVSTIEQNYSDGEFFNENHSLYTYHQVDGNTMVESETQQVWDSEENEWINSDRAVFVAEDGEIVRLEEAYWDNEWIFSTRVLISQENEDLVFLYQQLSFDNEWQDDYRDIYHDLTFLELYNILNEVFIDRIETGSSFAFLSEFPDYTEQYWDGENWVDEARQVTTEPSAEETIITQQESDGTEWMTFSEIRIHYENDLPVVYTLYEPDFIGDNMELVATNREDHSYNDQQLLTEIIQMELVQVTDEEDEEILTGRVVLIYSGLTTTVEPGTQPITFRLGDAYPNPFNPVTVIPFQAGIAGHVSIQVYDMLGRQIATLADENLLAGNHHVQFDASGLSSGVYMIRMQAPGLQQVKQVTLVK